MFIFSRLFIVRLDLGLKSIPIIFIFLYLRDIFDEVFINSDSMKKAFGFISLIIPSIS